MKLFSLFCLFFAIVLVSTSCSSYPIKTSASSKDLEEKEKSEKYERIKYLQEFHDKGAPTW